MNTIRVIYRWLAYIAFAAASVGHRSLAVISGHPQSLLVIIGQHHVSGCFSFITDRDSDEARSENDEPESESYESWVLMVSQPVTMTSTRKFKPR